MGCPVAQLEAVEVVGLDVSAPRQGVATWLAVGADARVAVDLGPRFFAQLAVGARVALNRPAVHFEGFGAAWEAPLFSGNGELGLGARF